MLSGLGQLGAGRRWGGGPNRGIEEQGKGTRGIAEKGGGVGRKEGRRTARVRNSMSLLADWRPRAEEREAAQEVVSSVVVLREGDGEVSVTWMSFERSGVEDVPETYSLAKTPLKAAQAPLAMARASH